MNELNAENTTFIANHTFVYMSNKYVNIEHFCGNRSILLVALLARLLARSCAHIHPSSQHNYSLTH